MVQHLYLGMNPLIFIEMRVFHHSNDDHNEVLMLGMNFLRIYNISVIITVKWSKGKKIQNVGKVTFNRHAF